MPFTPVALRFFRGRAKNNNKPWFDAHRAEHEAEVRAPMRDLIEEMNARFAKFAPEIGRSVFRRPCPSARHAAFYVDACLVRNRIARPTRSVSFSSDP